MRTLRIWDWLMGAGVLVALCGLWPSAMGIIVFLAVCAALLLGGFLLLCKLCDQFNAAPWTAVIFLLLLVLLRLY